MTDSSSIKNKMVYDAFISYSQAKESDLALAIQTGLHRLTKPWYKVRAMRVFVDKTDVSVTDDAWLMIQNSIDRSEYFILMASPQSAKRPWVRREIAHWICDNTNNSSSLDYNLNIRGISTDREGRMEGL